LVGDLTLGPEHLAFRAYAQKCFDVGKTNIILNCSRLRQIDTAGLNTLVLLQTELRRVGGQVVLLDTAQTEMELSLLAKLAVAFDVFTDQQEAVNGFFPDRAINHFDILQFVENEVGQRD
jgi:anti-anti-sigma regulatory factor